MKKNIITDIMFLKKKSEEAIQKEAKDIIKDLEGSLDLKRGIGLSAVQIGVLKKVGIIRLPKCTLDLINPKITNKDDRFRFKGEACLSLPGLRIDTARYMYITIENGDGRKYILEGLEAVAVQHEIDHMNGLNMIDRKWRKRR